jgi:hypothetical protein
VKTHHKRSSQAFRRAADWLGKHPAIAALVAPLLAALGTVVTALSDAATQQDSSLRSSKAATAEANRLRQEGIGDHMRIIARVAVAAIPDVVKATAALTLPPEKPDAEGLYASAEAMANAAEGHQDALVKAGMPSDTIPQLRVALVAYRAAVDERGQAVAQRAGATKSITVHVNRARKLVDSISPIVQKALRSDPVLLAEWKQLKRVTLKGVQGSVEVPGEGSTPAAPPDTTPLAASQAPVAKEEVS